MSSTPQRRPEVPTAKRAAVEAEVLKATEELLAEGATFAELGIERIASRAGISRTAFYFYFRDKRELLMRLTEDVSGQLYAEAERWWRGSGDGLAELRDALGRVLRLYRDHGLLIGVVVEVSTYDADVATFWRALVGRFVDATRARIEAEQSAGRAPAGPAGPIAFALVWMVERACYEQVAEGRRLDEPEFVEAIVSVWERSVYGRV